MTRVHGHRIPGGTRLTLTPAGASALGVPFGTVLITLGRTSQLVYQRVDEPQRVTRSTVYAIDPSTGLVWRLDSDIDIDGVHDGLRIKFLYSSPLKYPKTHRAIHRTRIQIEVIETLGDETSSRAFSRARGPVDGNDQSAE